MFVFISEFISFNLIFFIVLALNVILVERKILAYSQRRLGPILFGRNGLGQIVLDLVKLLTKETFLISKPASNFSPFFLFFFFFIQLLFINLFVLSNSFVTLNNIDAFVVYLILFIILSNVCFILTGFLSFSKYAVIGTIRSLVHIISMDIFVTLMFLIFFLISQSTHFNDLIFLQSSFCLFFSLIPLNCSYITILILESKRAPFDHAETESEVVAGYCIEYSGTLLLFFFLTEYLHILISSINFIIFFLGGYFLTLYINPLGFLLYEDFFFFFSTNLPPFF